MSKTDKVDLSLVPLTELLEEAGKRCSTFMYAYDLPDDPEGYNLRHIGRWDTRIFLSSILHYAIIVSGYQGPES